MSLRIVSQNEDAIVVETADQPTACIIWLHGLGADGSDFVPVAEQLALPADMALRFIFPHAPVIPITINQGYRMPGWYDVTHLEIGDRDEDSAGIRASVDRIASIVDQQQQAGIAAERIVIAGFSQGGAIALALALQYPQKLAGVMALSCYLPRCAQLEESPHHGLNIFMAHGTGDDVVKYQYGKMSYDALKSHEHAVIWHQYPMPHSVSTAEIRDIARWLEATLR